MVESGINYLSLGRKHSFMFPLMQLRLGMPHYNELYMFVPTYISQNYQPAKGFTAPIVGLKHEFIRHSDAVFSMEIAATLPTGSNSFGSNGTGYSLNEIMQYNFTENLGLVVMLSLNSLTMPSNSGGQRYFTADPFVLLSYDFDDKAEIYGEIFGQSRTAANQGAGFDFDFGLLYLLKKNWEVDIEAGQRLSGIPIGFNKYVGIGTAYLFG